MALPLPPMNLQVMIVDGISNLKNAVSIISGVASTDQAEVIVIRDEWSSILVRDRCPVELRLLRSGCLLYQLNSDGDGDGDGHEQHQNVYNYDIEQDDVVRVQKFLEIATQQDGFSFSITSQNQNMNISLQLSFFDKSDPLNPNRPHVGEGEGNSSLGGIGYGLAADDDSDSVVQQMQDVDSLKVEMPVSDSDQQPQLAALGDEVTSKKSLEVALHNNPAGFNAPPVADEQRYTVTAILRSETFFDILKGTYKSNIDNGLTDLTEELRITITRGTRGTELTFQSLGIDAILQQEDGVFHIQGPIGDQETFKLRIPFTNVKPLKLKDEKTGINIPGTGSVKIHVNHPQGFKPLLNLPVGPEGQLGNLFFSGDYV